jgi:superfamily II DNA or RNA helicase
MSIIIPVETSAMGFRVKVSLRGILEGCEINIGDFVRTLQQWNYDNRSMRWTVGLEFFYYDKQNHWAYFPLFALEEFGLFLGRHYATAAVVARPPVTGAKADFAMMEWVDYKNDKQKGAVEFLTNENSGPVRGLALQTGLGKTVSLIWSLQKLGVRSLITMTSRLEQWVSELVKYTTLTEDDVYTVQGVGGLTKIINNINEIKPSVILASTRTMQIYLEYEPSYQHLPHPSLLCESLDVGILSTDEAHESFFTNFQLCVTTNPSVFIPITATFVSNDKFVRNVLDQFIPKQVQFVGGDYERYVNVTSYEYTSGGGALKPFHYQTHKGYNQARFEDMLLKRLSRVFDIMWKSAIVPILQEQYLSVAEPGEKLLILCATTAMCDHMAERLKRETNKTVSVFYSGMPVTILERFDIILSTPGSAGTGRDIKNLLTCFVFDNTASEIRNLQYIGRLRRLPSGRTPNFCYLSVRAVKKHMEYNSKRATLYAPRALKLTHRTVP